MKIIKTDLMKGLRLMRNENEVGNANANENANENVVTEIMTAEKTAEVTATHDEMKTKSADTLAAKSERQATAKANKAADKLAKDAAAEVKATEKAAAKEIKDAEKAAKKEENARVRVENEAIRKAERLVIATAKKIDSLGNEQIKLKKITARIDKRNAKIEKLTAKLNDAPAADFDTEAATVAFNEKNDTILARDAKSATKRQENIDKIESQIEKLVGSLEARKAALVVASDKSVAQAAKRRTKFDEGLVRKVANHNKRVEAFGKINEQLEHLNNVNAKDIIALGIKNELIYEIVELATAVAETA